jgi:hypothetical protein
MQQGIQFPLLPFKPPNRILIELSSTFTDYTPNPYIVNPPIWLFNILLVVNSLSVLVLALEQITDFSIYRMNTLPGSLSWVE